MNLPDDIVGLHHVTCVTSDINKNLEFYRDILGLRLVKKTVNFDNPTNYHLYYGDYSGTPGRLITFLHIPELSQHKRGTGFTNKLVLAVPIDSLEMWQKKFHHHNVKMIKRGVVLGESFITIEDFEGLRIDLVETNKLQIPELDLDNTKYRNKDLKDAINGVYGVHISEYTEFDQTRLVMSVLKFSKIKTAKNAVRYNLPSGAFVEIRYRMKETFGNFGYGSIHHTAFATFTNEIQSSLANLLTQSGISVSSVIDRKYFNSIYFKNHQNILFEVATIDPGMLIDEDIDHLGEQLMLPEIYENNRQELEGILPSID